jgi:UDP-glucose 4-epimerase
MDVLSGCRILVTGGAGFLGSNVARLLQQKGAVITILDNCRPGYERNIVDLLEKAQFIRGDINDENVVKRAVQGKDAVVHTAFPVTQCDRSLERQYVGVGTVGLYNVLKEAHAQRALVVYASSISVYGRQLYTPIDERHPLDPVLLYGVTKLAGEYYCKVMAREYGLQVVMPRFSDLYGPGLGRDNAPVVFLKRARAGLPLVVRGGGKQIRSYLFATDAAMAVYLALTNPAAVGGVFNIASDETVTISGLAQKALQITGSKGEIVYEDGWVDEREYRIDSTLARTVLGFKPLVELETGLRKILAWQEEGEQA